LYELSTSVRANKSDSTFLYRDLERGKGKTSNKTLFFALGKVAHIQSHQVQCIYLYFDLTIAWGWHYVVIIANNSKLTKKETH
jgi:hypothetical protein